MSGGHNKGVNVRWQNGEELYGSELSRLRRENATRTPCGHCGVPILPANLARHEALHEDD